MFIKVLKGNDNENHGITEENLYAIGEMVLRMEYYVHY